MLRKRSARNSALHVGLLQAERELGRLEARVDRHGDRADHRGGVEQRHPGLVVAHAGCRRNRRVRTPSACIALAARRTRLRAARDR